MRGEVSAIHLAGEAGGPMRGVAEARALPGEGLEGDRYHARTGTYSRTHGPDREVTLVEHEALEAARTLGFRLEPGARRNIVVRGIALNALVGREFLVGPVRLRGLRRCDPCGHMARLSGAPGAEKALEGRGGLRAQVLEGGTVRVGDPVRAA